MATNAETPRRKQTSKFSQFWQQKKKWIALREHFVWEKKVKYRGQSCDFA